jgi:hypothetical protein
MMNILGLTAGTRAEERAARLPGDDLVPAADVVMDRGFDLPALPVAVWPWFAQLGKGRAGWYLPRWLECVLPSGHRALWRIEESLQHLEVGDVIADWGGRDATFEIVVHDAPSALVHRSTRGRLRISWAIVLRPAQSDTTRVHLRFKMSGARHRRLVEIGGGLVDLCTVAGLAEGLRERLAEDGWPPR